MHAAVLGHAEYHGPFFSFGRRIGGGDDLPETSAERTPFRICGFARVVAAVAHAPILTEEDHIERVRTGSHHTGLAGAGQLYARPVVIVVSR